jgi:uncharacterized oligopeptide transporter (OPT) family protein
MLINALGSQVVPDGKYLFDRDTQRIEVQWVPGIGSEKAAAPQARLMATVIYGILNRQLPWRLVLMGVFLVISIELLGISSLSFAVGCYLPIATALGIFVGGMVRWFAERGRDKDSAESGIGPGSLYASGLIAAGGIFGLLGIVIALLSDPELRYQIFSPGTFEIGPRMLGSLSGSNVLAVIMFALLAASQLYFARKRLG